MCVAESAFSLYPETSRKEIGTHLSDILKRSSGCSGGTNYRYKKVKRSEHAKKRDLCQLSSGEEDGHRDEEAAREWMCNLPEGLGTSKYRI